MPVKIKINWDNENIVSESVRIYRADTTFTSSALPPLLAEILGDVYEYEDQTTAVNETYFYMLSTKLGEQEVFSDCYSVLAAQIPPDTHLNTVTLLMQFDNALPLVDSVSGATWELSGDAFIDTNDKMFASGGALHVSDSVYSYARSPVLTNIYTPNSPNKALTVEFFFKKTSAIGNAGAVTFQNADDLSNRYAFFMRAGATNFNIAIYTTAQSTFIDVASGKNLNEWVHVAYVESPGNEVKLFIDGVEKRRGVVVRLPIEFWEKTIVTIGNNGINAESFGGLIDGLRVSRVSRYTANFTPPIGPFSTH